MGKQRRSNAKKKVEGEAYTSEKLGENPLTDAQKGDGFECEGAGTGAAALLDLLLKSLSTFLQTVSTL